MAYRLIGAALLALCLTQPARADIPASERQVLLDLYDQAGGAGWTSSTNWLGSAGTECTWFGVTCVADHVVRVELSSNHLVGNLPWNLNNLTQLQFFAVSSNQLSGSIPPLTGLAALRTFDIHYNQFTGSIPSLADLTALQEFDAYSNQLSGTLPPSLSGLTSLQRFFVDHNHIGGSIPSLAALTSLTMFSVQDNQFVGPAPAAPNPSSLQAAQSRLCPNYLDPSTASANDLVWDAATGSTPWSANCLGPMPALSIGNVTLAEGNAGTTAFNFVVSLDRTPPAPVSVDWYTSSGSAQPAPDYTGGTGTLTWNAGDASTRTITILVNGDTTVEPDEDFSVILSPLNLIGATIAQGTGTGTILNDDVAGIAPTITTTSLPGGVEGASYSFQVTATGTAPITFGASGLPAGLGIDPVSGLISGVPTTWTPGPVNVTITAANGILPNATQTFAMAILPQPVAAFVRPVPTLGEWGVLLLSVLVTAGIVVMPSRKAGG